MSGNICNFCKTVFPNQDKLNFDGWYLICPPCMKETAPLCFANLVKRGLLKEEDALIKRIEGFNRKRTKKGR